MKKQIRRNLSRVLVLVLVLCCGCASAFAATEVTLKKHLSYNMGRTTIAWDVTGDEPDTYKVTVEVINNGSAKQTRWNVGTTSSHSIQTTEYIPGKSYEITVSDGDGNVLAKKQYVMDDPVTFEDGKLKNTSIKIKLETRKRIGDADPKKVTFKAGEIIKNIDDNDIAYGLKFSMQMPQLAHPRSVFVTLAYESPDGYLDVAEAQDVDFDRVNRGYQTLWFILAGRYFFKHLYEATGDIPVGKYTTYLFFDGMWVNTNSFKVN